MLSSSKRLVVYYYLAFSHRSSATAVKLSSFVATPTDQGTLLEWRTGYEADSLGFHICEERGVRTRVTPKLIGGSALLTARGSQNLAGFAYQWIDRTPVAVGSVVAYWLQDVDLNGTKTLHGPIERVSGKMGVSVARPSFVLEGLARPASSATPPNAVGSRWCVRGGIAGSPGPDGHRRFVESVRRAGQGPRSLVESLPPHLPARIDGFVRVCEELKVVVQPQAMRSAGA